MPRLVEPARASPLYVVIDAIAGELERATLNSGAVAQNVGDVDKAMARAV